MVLCLLSLISPLKAIGSDREEELSREAIERELHKSRQWQTLMHYRSGTFGGSTSTVDDPAFFLSEKGKTSPEEELWATLEGMFSESAKEDYHALCRFPARAEWLRRELAIAEKDLPSPACNELEEYLHRVEPVSAALVFPESHINSPASMFGHTLLRLDSSAESRLLSHSVSYAADLPEDPGPFYAFKGVMGGYKGSFTVRPYYEKLKEYSHMESRDIQEYGLSLTPEEVRRMALHIWELREIRSDYYFFDENCSYTLLFLIEAARPEVRLTDRFFYWVLPTDTIRALKSEGLINSSVYRPSKASRIAHLESLASGSDMILKTSLDVSAGRAAPSGVMQNADLREEEKALTLDLAAEYTLHQYMGGWLDQETYSKRYLDTLSARSTLEKREYYIPPPTSPEYGHGTTRFTLGGGRQGEEDYSLIGLRVSYHGLMDPLKGYTPGAAIEVLKAEARHYSDTDETVLESFMLAEITSLWPGGNFIRPLSWRVRARAEREVSPEGDRTPLVLEGGAGLTASIGKGGLAYFLIEPSLKAGGGLRENYALGGGLSLGAFFNVGSAYNLMLSGRAFYYPVGDRHSNRSFSIKQNLRLSRNSSLELDHTRSRLDGLYLSDTSLSLNLYF